MRGDFLLPSIIVVLILGMTLFISSCGRGDKSIFDQLLVNDDWPGLSIELPGYSGPVKDKLGVDVSLSFKENGKSILMMGDKPINTSWKIKDDTLYISGGGVKAQARLMLDSEYDELQYFYLQDIEDYPIYFYSQKYLDTIDDRLAEISEKKDKKFMGWQETLDFDISTASKEFAERLKSYSFEKFEPISFANDKEKEEFVETYFKPLLTLGIEKTSWSYFYREGGDRLLDAYEIYIFNQELGSAEGKDRIGQEEFLPFDEVEEYIASRLYTYSDPSKYELQEMLMASRRYNREYHSLQMQIKEEDPPEFNAELLEAWYHEKFGGVRVIHMFYPDSQQHAWFLIEYNSYTDTPYYKGGSVTD